MPKNSAVTVRTSKRKPAQPEPQEVTREAHDAVVEWYRARTQYFGYATLAKRTGVDASTIRKVMLKIETPSGSLYTLPDGAIRSLYELTKVLAIPCNLPKTTKKNANRSNLGAR